MLISMRTLVNGDTVAETAEAQRDLKEEATSTVHPNLSANKEEFQKFHSGIPWSNKTWNPTFSMVYFYLFMQLFVCFWRCRQQNRASIKGSNITLNRTIWHNVGSDNGSRQSG
jgi:hypothetical protein